MIREYRVDRKLSEGSKVLQACEISKRFGATQALDGASVELVRGAVHILLGENGAGKSTLAKILAGVHCPDKGRILIDKRPVKIHDVDSARRLGIGMVFQELSLAPDLSVIENIFLGTEVRKKPFSRINRRDEARRCREVFSLLNISLPLQAPVCTLPVAHKQMVEFAKVLVRDPKIIIMDEPTSTLTDHERKSLFSVIEELKRQGVAILYVTHHLREVKEIGDLVSVMVDGEVIESRSVTKELSEKSLVSMMTRRSVETFSFKKKPILGDLVFSVSGLKTRHGCRDVDLNIRYGEIVGVYGVAGCGRNSLVRALVGAERALAGNLTLDSCSYSPRHPAHARRMGVSFLPMDRKENGILATRPIRENLNLMNLRHLSVFGGGLSFKRERTETSSALRELFVRYGSQEDAIVTLSGGNQQKVLFGRALFGQPKLVILEEPTAGVDIGSKEDLYKLMNQLREQRISFLVCSSDLSETLAICDRVYSMYEGQMVREYREPSQTDEALVIGDVLGTGYRSCDAN